MMQGTTPIVTLIATMHKQTGLCNPEELCRIIEDTAPDIIFEELSQECFDLSYQEQSLKGLETEAIKLYLQRHQINHVPIDCFGRKMR